MSVKRQRLDQNGDIVEGDDVILTLDKWEDRWQANKIKFHKPFVHPMLKKHIDIVTCGRDQLTFFLPLCGKSLDLKWLAEQGHVVIGNEGVTLGCQQFFEENRIEYTVSEMELIPGKCYKSKDTNLNITLINCDFYNLTSDIVGHIDCVWDRGALAAVNRGDCRKMYSDVMVNLMSPDTRYLLDTFGVDNEVFAGPPHDMPAEELTELFGRKCSIELVEEKDSMNDWTRSWGVDYFFEYVHLLQLK